MTKPMHNANNNNGAQCNRLVEEVWAERKIKERKCAGDKEGVRVEA